MNKRGNQRTDRTKSFKVDRVTWAADFIIRTLRAQGGKASVRELVHETVDDRDDAPIGRLSRRDFEAGVKFLMRLGVLETGAKAA